MIVAAPIIRKPLSILGHPGLTDFTSIYIASELNAREYRTTLRHEQAHVWAAHNRRRTNNCKDEQWKVACEMEIARNIYDKEDIETIQSPRSRLAGAYLPDSIPSMPTSVLLAEDIYEWLLLNPQETQEDSSCGCSCSHDESSEKGEEGPISITEVRHKLDEEEKSEKSTVAAKSAYTALVNRPPSITDFIDSALRYRVIREDSYRRPSRRPDQSEIILKGKLSTPRPPLVEIFVDRSGSFSAQKTALAEQALASILKKYGASIKCDTWFFGNGTLSERDISGAGDTPYHLVASHLCLSHPKIAIIITDDDPAGEVCAIPKAISTICIPIGCTKTQISIAMKGKDAAVVR